MADASSSPLRAWYSNTAPPPSRGVAAAYRRCRRGSVATSVIENPAGTRARRSVAPLVTLTSRSVRRNPTHTVRPGPGPGVTDTSDSETSRRVGSSVQDRIRRSDDGLTWCSTSRTRVPCGPLKSGPYTHRNPLASRSPDTLNRGPLWTAPLARLIRRSWNTVSGRFTGTSAKSAPRDRLSTWVALLTRTLSRSTVRDGQGPPAGAARPADPAAS